MERLANRAHKTDLTDNAYKLLYSLKGKIKGKTKLCALIAYPQQT